MSYIEKLSILTGVPVKTLKRFWDTTLMYISNEVHQQKDKEIRIVHLEPIGSLSVREINNSFQCTFNPSEGLTNAVERGMSEDTDALQSDLENEIISKLEKICNGIV